MFVFKNGTRKQFLLNCDTNGGSFFAGALIIPLVLLIANTRADEKFIEIHSCGYSKENPKIVSAKVAFLILLAVGTLWLGIDSFVCNYFYLLQLVAFTLSNLFAYLYWKTLRRPITGLEEEKKEKPKMKKPKKKKLKKNKIKKAL